MDEFVPSLDRYHKVAVGAASWYFHPIFLNSERLNFSKPALFVGNHTIYGVMDVPLMLTHLYQKHGAYVRSLGDRVHFQVPIWRNILKKHGVLLGSPENCHQLMASGQSILVFPGGAREVMRRKGEKYQLIWKNRAGFARLAIEHGYDIIPFASLGADDCYDILYDANDLQANAMAQKILDTLDLTEKLRGGDIIPSLAKGLAYLPIPKPQRFYFSFGDRISTTEMGCHQEHAWALREQVAQSIEQQLVQLKDYRNHDKQNWSWLRQKLAGNTEA